MGRYIIFGLILALLGAILALNNTSEVEINLPFTKGIETTVARILVGSGLALLVSLILLGIIDYFSRLSLIATFKEKFIEKEKVFKSQIEELEWEISGLKNDLIRAKEELKKTQEELSRIKDAKKEGTERSESYFPR